MKLLFQSCVHPLIRYSPRPSLSIQTPVMNRLRQILDPDILTTTQIGRCTSHLQNPVIRPRRQLQPFHGRFQKRSSSVRQLTHFAHHPAGQMGIAMHVVLSLTFWGFKKLGNSEHKTVKPAQMLMPGRMFN